MITKQIEGGTMMLIPPKPGVCQTCATDHEPHLPHNAQSLYYQTAFNMEHGRAVTWGDAMAHCSEEIKEAWGEQLDRFGVDWRNGRINPEKKA